MCVCLNQKKKKKKNGPYKEPVSQTPIFIFFFSSSLSLSLSLLSPFTCGTLERERERVGRESIKVYRRRPKTKQTHIDSHIVCRLSLGSSLSKRKKKKKEKKSTAHIQTLSFFFYPFWRRCVPVCLCVCATVCVGSGCAPLYDYDDDPKRSCLVCVGVFIADSVVSKERHVPLF